MGVLNVEESALIGAINMALARAMEEDENVVIFGEDVGVNGGVFRATEGLLKRFGTKRVIDMPLSEVLIGGMPIGLGVEGIRAVAEIQFAGFGYSVIDQWLNHAGRMRTRTRGQKSCPIVVRMPCGAGIRAPECHGEWPEAMFAHIPGIRVVIPSSPARAYGLLLSAIRDPDPVVFLEPSRIFHTTKEPVVDNGVTLPLDSCFVLREGNDITLVTWGAAVQEVLQAADRLAEEGADAEVIDVATVKFIDHNTICRSVQKTKRCVIVHEAPRTCGVGAEVAATLAEKELFSLLAPIKRVTGFDTPPPYFLSEWNYIPTVERILSAARESLKYS